MKRISGLVLLSSVLAACGGTTQSDPGLEELNEARALWASYGIDAYRLEVERDCYCLPEDLKTLVIVSSPDNIEVLAPETLIYLTDHPTEFSVEMLFDQIEAAIVDPNAGVEAVFDAEFGYPKSVHFDPIKNAVDDEVSYQINLISHYQLSQKVAAMKALWESQQLDTYEIDLFAECFQCSIRQTVTTIQVEANEAVSAVYADDGQSADLATFGLYPVTVDQMFSSLEYHLQRAKSDIDLTFSERGYPTSFNVDPNITVYDDQISIKISSLR